MDLLLAPFLTRIVLVEAGEIAVVALVERLVPDGFEARLARLLKHQVERLLRAQHLRPYSLKTRYGQAHQ